MIHSAIQSIIQSGVQSWIQSCVQSIIQSIIQSLIQSGIHSGIQSIGQSVFHSGIQSGLQSRIQSQIQSERILRMTEEKILLYQESICSALVNSYRINSCACYDYFEIFILLRQPLESSLYHSIMNAIRISLENEFQL